MAATSTSANVTSLPAERFFRVSLFLLLLTSVVTVVSTGKLELLSSTLAPAAVLYKGFRWWRGRPAELSQRTATWMVLGYLAIFPLDVLFFSRVYVANSSNPPLFAALLGAVHFLLYVMLVRLYSAVTDRDAVFLAMLSFAALLASAVLTVDTTFLALFFVFLLCGVATFVGMELRRGAKGAVFPLFAAQPERERRLTRALSLAALSVAAGAILIGGTLFFFFPRINAGYLGRTSFNPTLMSGFTDDVELGQIGEIKQNSAVVMHVKTGKPIEYDRLRWRGIALTTFDGKRWSSSADRSERLGAAQDGSIPAAPPDQNPRTPGLGIQYEVFLEPIATDAIFAPADVISLRGDFSGDSGNVFAAARRSYLNRDPAGSLFNPFHNFSAIRYSGLSRLPYLDLGKLREAPAQYPAEIRDTYLQLPPRLDPRIPALANQIAERAETPIDKTVAIEGYLRSRFTYTLKLAGKPGDDPLAHFLFETGAGHCEYFATAMAVMLRTLGIPTREVNGFLSGEYNDLAGDYIVRASDAHSWVEVYFSGTGWLTFDPTPPAADRSSGFLTRLGQYADWMSLSWNEWVVSYDFSHQVVLAQKIQRDSRSWSELVRGWFARTQEKSKNWIKSWQFQHAQLGLVLPFLLVLFLTVLRFDLAGAAIRRLRLALQLRASKSAQANPQLASRLYGELLRMLEGHGFVRRDSQTPFEFAAVVGEPRLAPVVQEFTHIYAHARFGAVPCDALRLRQLLDQVRSALRGK